jgi:hypothetical protein
MVWQVEKEEEGEEFSQVVVDRDDRIGPRNIIVAEYQQRQFKTVDEWEHTTFWM